MRPLFHLLALVLIADQGMAQDHFRPAGPMDTHVFGEGVRHRIDATGRLHIDHFNEGRRTGQDRFSICDLDAEAHVHDPSTPMIVLSCREGNRCVEREDLRTGLLKRSSRYVIHLPPGDDGARTMEALHEVWRASPCPHALQAGVTR